MANEKKYGTLRGKKILLETAETELSKEDLEQVEVERDGGGTFRPWRFATPGSEVVWKDDGTAII